MSRGDGVYISRAIAMAAEAHAGQLRKGRAIPYVWHPIAVGRLLTDLGARKEVVVAGILHDTLEDTDLPPAAIEAEFGSEVLELVLTLSELDKSLSWEERKQHHIDAIRSASFDARLITAADKLDNLSSTATDMAERGPHVWERFKRGAVQQEWYYRAMAEAVRGLPRDANLPVVPSEPDLTHHPLFDLLDAMIEKVFGRK